MIKLKDLLAEAKKKDDGHAERYEKERQDAVDALRHMVQSVEKFRSPAETRGDTIGPNHEKTSADIMAKFVDKVHKLEREWFNMTRKI